MSEESVLFKSLLSHLLESFSPTFRNNENAFCHNMKNNPNPKSATDLFFSNFPRNFQQYKSMIENLTLVSQKTASSNVKYLSSIVDELVSTGWTSRFESLKSFTSLESRNGTDQSTFFRNFGFFFLSDLICYILSQNVVDEDAHAALVKTGLSLAFYEFSTINLKNTYINQWAVIFSLISETNLAAITSIFSQYNQLTQFPNVLSLIKYIRFDHSDSQIGEEVDIPDFLSQILNIVKLSQKKKLLTNDILSDLSYLILTASDFTDIFNQFYEFAMTLKDIKMIKDNGFLLLLGRILPRLSNPNPKTESLFESRVYSLAPNPEQVELSVRLFNMIISGKEVDPDWLFWSWGPKHRTSEFLYIKWCSNPQDPISFQNSFMQNFFQNSDFSMCPTLFQDLLLHLISLDWDNFFTNIAPAFSLLPYKDPRYLVFLRVLPFLSNCDFHVNFFSIVNFDILQSFYNDSFKSHFYSMIYQLTSGILPTRTKITKGGDSKVTTRSQQTLHFRDKNGTSIDSLEIIKDSPQIKVKNKRVSLIRAADLNSQEDTLPADNPSVTILDNEFSLQIDADHRVGQQLQDWMLTSYSETKLKLNKSEDSGETPNCCILHALQELNADQKSTDISLIHYVLNMISSKSEAEAKAALSQCLQFSYHTILNELLFRMKQATVNEIRYNYTYVIYKLMKSIESKFQEKDPFAQLFSTSTEDKTDNPISKDQRSEIDYKNLEYTFYDIEVMCLISLGSVYPELRLISWKLLQLMSDIIIRFKNDRQSQFPQSYSLSSPGIFYHISHRINSIEQSVKKMLLQGRHGYGELSLSYSLESHYYEVWLAFLSEICNFIIVVNYSPILSRLIDAIQPFINYLPTSSSDYLGYLVIDFAAHYHIESFIPIKEKKQGKSLSPSDRESILSLDCDESKLCSNPPRKVKHSSILADLPTDPYLSQSGTSHYSKHSSHSIGSDSEATPSDKKEHHHHRSLSRYEVNSINNKEHKHHHRKISLKDELKLVLPEELTPRRMSRNLIDPKINKKVDKTKPDNRRPSLKLIKSLLSSDDPCKGKLALSLIPYLHTCFYPYIIEFLCELRPLLIAESSKAVIGILYNPNLTPEIRSNLLPYILSYLAVLQSRIITLKANGPRIINWTHDLEKSVSNNIVLCTNFCKLHHLVFQSFSQEAGDSSEDLWPLATRSIIMQFFINWANTKTNLLKPLRQLSLKAISILVQVGPLFIDSSFFNESNSNLFATSEENGKQTLSYLLNNHLNLLLETYIDSAFFYSFTTAGVFFESIITSLIPSNAEYIFTVSGKMVLLGLVYQQIEHPRSLEFQRSFSRLIGSYKGVDESSLIKISFDTSYFYYATEQLFAYAFYLIRNPNLAIPVRDVISAIRPWIKSLRLLPKQTTLVSGSQGNFKRYTPYLFLQALMEVTERFSLGETSSEPELEPGARKSMSQVFFTEHNENPQPTVQNPHENDNFIQVAHLWVDLLECPDNKEIVPLFISEWHGDHVKQLLFDLLIQADEGNITERLVGRCSFAYYYHITKSLKLSFDNEFWIIPPLITAFSQRLPERRRHIPIVIHFALLFTFITPRDDHPLLRVLLDSLGSEIGVEIPDEPLDSIPLIISKLTKEERTSWGNEALKWFFGSSSLEIATHSLMIYNHIQDPFEEPMISGVAGVCAYHLEKCITERESEKIVPLITEAFKFYTNRFPHHELFAFQFAACFLDSKVFVESALPTASQIFIQSLSYEKTKQLAWNQLVGIVRPLIKNLEHDANSQKILDLLIKSTGSEELVMIAAPLKVTNPKVFPSLVNFGQLLKIVSETAQCKALGHYSAMADSASPALLDSLFVMSAKILEKIVNENNRNALAKLYKTALNYTDLPGAMTFIVTLARRDPAVASKPVYDFYNWDRAPEDVLGSLRDLLKQVGADEDSEKSEKSGGSRGEKGVVTITDCRDLEVVFNFLKMEVPPRIVPYASQQEMLSGMRSVVKNVRVKRSMSIKRWTHGPCPYAAETKENEFAMKQMIRINFEPIRSFGQKVVEDPAAFVLPPAPPFVVTTDEFLKFGRFKF